MKNFKLKAMTPLLVGTCMLTLAVSCGNDDDSSSGIGQQQQQEDQGIYRARLTPLNTASSGNPSGNATITILGDEVLANVIMEGVSPGKHLQHVHLAGTCPTETQDANGDGLVDVVEAVSAAGPILIPLDGNIEAQNSGSNGYPSAGSDGRYVWTKRGSLARLIADLRAEDTNTEDSLVKLPEGQELNLAGRVVVIHGVSANSNLPETVQTINGLPAYETLPIACGVLERVGEDQEDEETNGTNGTTGTPGTTGTNGTTGTDGTTGTNGTTGGTTTGDPTTTGNTSLLRVITSDGSER
jgi:hypothetical protein